MLVFVCGESDEEKKRGLFREETTSFSSGRAEGIRRPTLLEIFLLT